MSEPVIRKAGAIIINKRKLLVSRSKGKSYFIAPGGKLEHNESFEEALIRELKEEQNILVTRADTELFGSYQAIATGHEKDRTRIEMKVFLVHNYLGKLTPSAEIEENRWVNSSDSKNIELGSIFAHDVIPALMSRGLIE